MANMHLVTGYAGQEHVTAADQGAFNTALFGSGQFVLGKGNKLSASVVTNNLVRVLDGDLYMQGRHIRLDEGTYVDLTIENGAQGMLRNDLIVARYTKDSLSGVEDCNLVVIKGTASAGTATDPAYTSGDIINDHVLLAEMPLFRIPLDGLNVQPLVPLFEEASLVADGSVGSAKLADKAVNTAKLDSKAVTKEKIAAGATYSALPVTLTVEGWASNYQTVNVSGVTASNLVIVSPDPGSHVAYGEASVRCVAQEAGKLSFACESVPAVALVVNVVIPT